ncbi:MAG: methylated-DNA--[protein]-cysteine S-methyltransferase [Chlorobium sp.]|nr:methylated-DNA--[protein]-cysteine S-methyltransferase [Chlorobium phaeovibrioides]NQU46288.1 methylated-DNA--[protein]-cysteine S-methyltransferase [Chlorobium sp.]
MLLAIHTTCIGKVGIAEENGLITNLFFEGELPVPEPYSEASALTCEAFRHLDAYLNGDLKTFSLPLSPPSTLFSARVRQALLLIPYGSTATYAAIAMAVGSPTAARAVGTVCSRNPMPIVIPCHRVVPSGSGFGGYRGGLKLKAALNIIENKAATA